MAARCWSCLTIIDCATQAGVGHELCKILYRANGIVYLTSRIQSNANAAAESIPRSRPESKGRAEGLQLDLTDLREVKKTARVFLGKETALDVLWNNAGVMLLPSDGSTVQGHELRMGANCLGPYLLTQELLPALIATAAVRRREGEANGIVRVLFSGSMMIDTTTPRK